MTGRVCASVYRVVLEGLWVAKYLNQMPDVVSSVLIVLQRSDHDVSDI